MRKVARPVIRANPALLNRMPKPLSPPQRNQWIRQLIRRPTS